MESNIMLSEITPRIHKIAMLALSIKNNKYFVECTHTLKTCKSWTCTQHETRQVILYARLLAKITSTRQGMIYI